MFAPSDLKRKHNGGGKAILPSVAVGLPKAMRQGFGWRGSSDG